jgi:hypothetical protein
MSPALHPRRTGAILALMPSAPGRSSGLIAPPDQPALTGKTLFPIRIPSQTRENFSSLQNFSQAIYKKSLSL